MLSSASLYDTNIYHSLHDSPVSLIGKRWCCYIVQLHEEAIEF